MAVVGHAHVVVRAITDKVDSDIRKGFSGAGASANKAGEGIGDNLAKGISKGLGGIRINTFTDKVNQSLASSQELAENFTSLMRRGYAVQGAFGAIVGSIGALVGGLGALIGAAGGAATALVAVGSAAITAKAGMAIASFALKGVGQAVGQATDANRGLGRSFRDIAFDAEAAALAVDRAAINLENAREAVLRTQDLPSGSRVRREAELAYKEAELAYKRAQEAKKQGGDGAGGAGGGDPYAGLTPAQKTFAKYLASLKPLMDDLREAAAKGFLPILQQQLERLIAARLPEILEQKFQRLGEGAGKAVEKFTDIFLSGDNLQDFSDILDDMSENLPSFGTILGNVFSGFLSIMEAADPLTRNFIAFLEEKTGSFRNFLDTKQASGELTIFFNRAGEIMGNLGAIFGNTFTGLGNVIMANFGPGSGGDMILQWLIKLTEGFQNVDSIGLEKYFKGAADNFIAMGDAIAGAANTIVASGSNPAVGDFWRNLDAGAFAFSEIVRGSIEAAPALGDTLRLFTEIVAILTDGATATAFFETINFALGGIAETLRALKPLLDFAGPIFATLSALLLLRGALLGFTSIFLGFTAKAAVAIGSLFGFNAQAALTKVGLLKLIPVATKSGIAMTAALGPVGVAIAAVVAGIGLLAMTLGGIKGSQMENATKGVTRGFKEGADAATLWGEATKAVMDGPAKQNIAGLKNMRENLQKLGKVQEGYSGPTTTLATASTTALADSFEAMGRSLGNIATDDLPGAQASFKKFTKELGLNNSEVATALNEMDDYKKILIEQADQLAINIRTTDGQIDMQKLANFAIGEGEIAQRKANEETAKAIDKLAEQTRAFVDYGGLLNQNKEDVKKWAEAQASESKSATDTWKDYWDGQAFSVDKYLDDIEAQIEAGKNWQANIGKLTGELDQKVLDQIIAMGPRGAQLVASLTDGVNDKEQIARLNRAGAATGDGYWKSAQNAITNRGPLQIKAGIASDHVKQLELMFRPNVVVPSGGRPAGVGGRKDGGFIKGYFDGGHVTGLGTARSDSIPAMLSNGEFVVNARATAQNRELLESINNNQTAPVSQSVTIHVNPAPGMNETEIAEIVSRKIAFAMTKGGY